MSIINNGNTKHLQVTKHLKKRSNSQKYMTNEYDFFLDQTRLCDDHGSDRCYDVVSQIMMLE